MIYFSSDFHFGHKNIIKLDRPQFEDIQEHDQFIIKKVNEVVKHTDTLWILGDVWTPRVMKHLNGIKYLVLGNHDKRSMKEYEAYVKKVYKYPVYITSNILVSHEPQPVPPNVLNIHGHLHGAILDSPNHLNVCISTADWKLYSMKDVERLVTKLPVDNQKFLQEWYADLYKFTAPKDDVITDKYGRIDLEMTKFMRKRGL